MLGYRDSLGLETTADSDSNSNPQPIRSSSHLCMHTQLRAT